MILVLGEAPEEMKENPEKGVESGLRASWLTPAFLQNPEKGVESLFSYLIWELGTCGNPEKGVESSSEGAMLKVLDSPESRKGS